MMNRAMLGRSLERPLRPTPKDTESFLSKYSMKFF